MQRVLAEAGIVSGISQVVRVITDCESPKVHELLALGELVLIEDDFLFFLFLGVQLEVLATIDGILVTLFCARVIEIIALFVSSAGISLLNVAQQLLI